MDVVVRRRFWQLPCKGLKRHGAGAAQRRGGHSEEGARGHTKPSDEGEATKPAETILR